MSQRYSHSLMIILFLCTLSMGLLPRSLNAQLFSSSRSTSFEPFGAEDFGSEDAAVSIPEPLVFDLVRPLGAHKGESEANVLAEFPFDGEIIDWAPEIEYAIADGVALEFEVPFENSHLAAYKFAGQWTFGTNSEQTYIHGTQVILEPDVDFEEWEIFALYLGGYRFDETWSTLFMLGGVTEIEEGDGVQHTSGIFNVSLFADTSESTSIGLESDFQFGDNSRTTYELIPQLHLELTDQSELQLGCGVGFEEDREYGLFATRAIVSW